MHRSKSFCDKSSGSSSGNVMTSLLIAVTAATAPVLLAAENGNRFDANRDV